MTFLNQLLIRTKSIPRPHSFRASGMAPRVFSRCAKQDQLCSSSPDLADWSPVPLDVQIPGVTLAVELKTEPLESSLQIFHHAWISADKNRVTLWIKRPSENSVQCFVLEVFVLHAGRGNGVGPSNQPIRAWGVLLRIAHGHLGTIASKPQHRLLAGFKGKQGLLRPHTHDYQEFSSERLMSVAL